MGLDSAIGLLGRIGLRWGWWAIAAAILLYLLRDETAHERGVSLPIGMRRGRLDPGYKVRRASRLLPTPCSRQMSLSFVPAAA